MTVTLAFALLGLIIFIGFFGSLIFQRTKVPDLLALVLIGVVLGPVLNLFDPGTLSPITPFFGTLALIIILFNGGLELEIDRIVRQFAGASLLVLLVFTASLFLIAVIAHYLFSYGWVASLLLGAILGCTSSAIVFPVVSRLQIHPDTKVLLSLESALSDVLSVIISLSLIEILGRESPGFAEPFRELASGFSIAVVAGIAAGVAWLKILKVMKGQPFSYMITLAMLFLLFSLTEWFHGNGAMASLVFGLVLGNQHRLGTLFSIGDGFELDEKLRWFHAEVSFFIRTFFFVYIGLIFTLRQLDLGGIAFCLVITLVLILARQASVFLLVLLYPQHRDEREILSYMLPRGLTSAVLASLAIVSGIGEAARFVDYTLIIIFLTNIILTVGIILTERKKAVTAPTTFSSTDPNE
ncbi:MAG: cation:proton antiporter [Nitrospirae bacterium]|nr:cation:proton antiporter [Nitrospirota bacterium]